MGFNMPVVINPSIQRYAWGDIRFLPRLFGVPEDGTPWAEAWYGTHPAAPADATVNGEKVPLNRLVQREQTSILGEKNAARYGDLPYLLKILAAEKPLSIQVHPTREQAEAGFAREEAAGIPRDGAARSYRDPNHKPEVMVAWTKLHALVGFRLGEELTAALAQIPELTAHLPAVSPNAAGLRTLVEAYFSLTDEIASAALGVLLARLEKEDARSAFTPDQPAYWALRAHRMLNEGTPPDRGLLFAFLLQLVHLDPGEALFIPPGVPHAYLQGAGLELMVSSDNVVRAGLTPKHIDVPELLRIVRFDAGAPPKLLPVETTEGADIYALPVTELDLRLLMVPAGKRVERCAGGPETIVAKPGGDVTVLCNGETLALSNGQACLIPAGASYAVLSQAGAQVFAASTPESPPPHRTFRDRAPRELAFGTSGLRGLVEDITDLEVYINTRGFLDYLIADEQVVFGMSVALAGDLRPSTDRILRAVAAAVRDAGLSVVYCGRIPTPALSYYGFQNGMPSIMVTGSHIPFDRNGIKFNRPGGEVLKSDEAPILAATARVREREYRRNPETSIFDDNGAFLRPPSALPETTGAAAAMYKQRYTGSLPADALKGLRVGFYEHSAVGREMVVEILESLGATVYPAGRSDIFVPIDTEALSAERLSEMQSIADRLVAQYGPLDALVSTDGDSDRPLLLGIEENGQARFYGGDILGAIVADYLDADSIAVPVSSNDAIDRHFSSRGVPVVRTRIGSPWVISKMAELTGERRVGWEANGGFLVGTRIKTHVGAFEPLATRDAVLPLVATLHFANRAHVTLRELFSRLPGRFSRAGLLDNVEPSASRAILRRFGLGDPALRSARYKTDSIELCTFDGEVRPAEGERVAHLTVLRRDLERLFSTVPGLDSVALIDILDGLRIHFSGGDIAHVRPSGNAPQLRIYATSDTPERAEEIVHAGLKEPDGLLRALAENAHAAEYFAAVNRNILLSERLIADKAGPKVVGTVCGSAAAQVFWQARLDIARTRLGSREAISFHEDLPVNQAFGLLLMWQRLRPHLREGEGALVAFVFGEGSRATPFTEAECGQKPAVASFVMDRGDSLSIVELALRTFAPVEAFLRRSGFSGIVVKWGDEVQIPIVDLSGTDPRFADADVVRFVSMRAMTEDDARNKDWVGVDPNGNVTAFIPRRPLEEMGRLAERGLLQRDGNTLIGGINLGSIALSRKLLDILADEFSSEIADPEADRSRRPDLDPQLFTALTVALIEGDAERQTVWKDTCAESRSVAKLAENMPDVIVRLHGALERFREKYGRPVQMRALDFGDQYWGDVGQHRQMFELYTALADEGTNGDIARALAGIDGTRDAAGNLISGNTRLGPGVEVRDSVLVDVQIDSGRIERSVLIGTRAGKVEADGAFDVLSSAVSLTLAPRAGSYKVVSSVPISAGPGDRITTVFLSDAELLMRVNEDTDLRDRANTYNMPILGNSLSFREAHERVVHADPANLAARRDAARRRVETVLGDREKLSPGN